MGSHISTAKNKQKVVQDLALLLNIFWGYILIILQKLGHQDLHDKLTLRPFAYERSMGVFGIDDKELSGLYQRPCGLGIGVEGKVVLLVEGSLALSYPRYVFACDEFCLGEGNMDVDILTVGFQLGTGGRDKFGVYYVDEQVGTVQFYTAGRNLAEIVGLDVVKNLLEKRMQSLVAGTVYEMGLYHDYCGNDCC